MSGDVRLVLNCASLLWNKLTCGDTCDDDACCYIFGKLKRNMIKDTLCISRNYMSCKYDKHDI